MAASADAPAPKQRSKIGAFFADQRRWTPYVFVAPFFITFFVFTLYPLLWAAKMGFQESLGYTNTWEWIGFANYIEAITDDKHLWTSFKNFITYTVGSLATQIPIALILALLLTSLFLRMRGFFRTTFFIPSVLPGVTMGVIGVWFFNESRGFANTFLMGLGMQDRIQWTFLPQYIIPMLLTLAFWQWTGSHAVFFIAGISGMDRSILEAATVDGANSWQRTRYIVIPLLKPVIAFISITAAAGSLTLYEVPAILFSSGSGGGPGAQGWFFMTYIVDVAFQKFRMGYATAIGWLVFLLAVIVTLIQLRLYDYGEVN